MSWETRRNGRRYYYRVRKRDGKLIKEYCGGGLVGILAAEGDARKRAMRQTERQVCEEYSTTKAVLVKLNQHSADLVKAALLAAGYHQHRREWRRRRVCKT